MFLLFLLGSKFEGDCVFSQNHQFKISQCVVLSSLFHDTCVIDVESETL